MPRTFNYRFPAALSCAAVLFLSGCATPCQTTVESGRHRLIQGTVTPISADASLTLISVNDSRCPERVQCIWAGRIDYQLQLQSCGRTETFTLSTAPQASGRPPAFSHELASAPGMLIRLVAEPPQARDTKHVTVELTHR